MNPVPIGLDDGYAYTKVALPDGRLFVIPSRARTGQAGVTWIDGGEQRIFEYETEGVVYSVGAVDGAPTHFEGYPWSLRRRALRDEAAAFDEIDVGEDRRTDHASFIENTEGQAAGWNALGEALGGAEPNSEMINELTTDLTELTLGRNDLADEMGLAGCRARALS